MNGDMGWTNNQDRQKLEIIQWWSRIIKVIFYLELKKYILTECGLQQNYKTKCLFDLKLYLNSFYVTIMKTLNTF